jgi:hypothetical protein
MSAYFVTDEKKQYISFPLRLAASLKRRAATLANEEGISLNHFIVRAVAEKISRLREGNYAAGNEPRHQPDTVLATRVRCEVKREFTAYTVTGLQPRRVLAGNVVFAILTPATADTAEIEFTWGSVGDIRYRAPRDLFLQSTLR